MRDVIFIRLSELEELVISSDCSGCVGTKESDQVHVSSEIISYYGFRVALMELLAVGATPIALIIHNLIDGHEWVSLKRGAINALSELGLPTSIPITGSSETNFELLQSAVGFTVIGKMSTATKKIGLTPVNAKLAVIGVPLFGQKVLSEHEKVAPLSLFKELLELKGVYEIIPVGSKGIAFELMQLLSENQIPFQEYHCKLDLNCSAGPATCFIISFNSELEAVIEELASSFYYVLSPHSL